MISYRVIHMINILSKLSIVCVTIITAVAVRQLKPPGQNQEHILSRTARNKSSSSSSYFFDSKQLYRSPVTSSKNSYIPMDQYLEVYRKNNERIMKKSEALYKKMNSAELDRVCIEQGAERICDLRTVDGIRFCYFHCMFTREGVGHLDSFYRFFYFMFDDFCKPFRTNYQSLFSTKSGRDSFKSYKKFQNLLDMDEKNLKTLIYQFSNAILGSIIQYTETPYKALRPIFTRIEKALIDQFPNNTHNVFENNPDCILIKPLLAYESFGQGLKSDSAIENLMLPGFFLLNTIAKYINAKVSLRYTALMEINRYVSGNSSGFGCASWSKDIKGYNESIDIEEDIHHGKSPKGICDDLGRPPAMGFPIPPVANDQLHYATISKIIMCTDSSPSNDAS